MILESESSLFNKNTLNIFTDASVCQKDHNTCPGFVSYIGKDRINEKYLILDHSTNNEGEIYAIYMAITEAILKKPFISRINIFSDSRISVMGLREWIFNWIQNRKDSVLYNSSGEIVKNQELFLNCVFLILKYNLKIHLYHVRGHMNPGNETDVHKFIDSFKAHNECVFFQPSISLAIAMMNCNAHIDNLTRNFLERYGNDSTVFHYNPKIDTLISPIYSNPIDMDKYKKLVSGHFY